MSSEPYVPVNCGFHDRLLDFATRAQTVTVLLKGGMNRFDTKIKDVFTRGGAEFITFDNGETYRLDELATVNDHSSDTGVCLID